MSTDGTNEQKARALILESPADAKRREVFDQAIRDFGQRAGGLIGFALAAGLEVTSKPVPGFVRPETRREQHSAEKQLSKAEARRQRIRERNLRNKAAMERSRRL